MGGRRPRLPVLVAVAGAVCTLAACSGGGSSSTTTSTTAHPGTTTSTTAAPATTTSTSQPPAVNLPVTDALRTQLVAAGAAVNNIPVSEFSGLTHGLTYYALDHNTGTYWAGAQLDPAPVPAGQPPSAAQVASQDAGAYYVFIKPAGQGWTAHASGNTGQGTVCPLPVPAEVLQVWGWPAGSCRPSGV